MGRDLHFVLRGMIRRPGAPLFAALTLGLGVAGTLAVGSVVRGVLLRDLPYPDADRLVLVWRGTDEDPALRGALSPADWLDIRERASSFDGVAGLNAFRTTFQPEAGDTEQVDLGVVTGEFFDVLGVSTLLGRNLRPEDDRTSMGPDDPAVIVLEHDFWQTRFGGDPAIVGRSIRLGGTPHLVVGILPESFEMLLPPEAGMRGDLAGWTPLALDYASQPRDGFYLKVVARLSPGVGPERADAELGAVASSLRAEHTVHDDAGLRLRAALLEDEVVAHVRPFLVILGLVGGVVLLVTCANVSALLLVRFLGRSNETAVRRALGAERPRLMASFLAESGIVALAGTVAGLLVAGPVVRGLMALQPDVIPRADQVTIDGGLVALSFGLAAIVTLLCGLGPALLGTLDGPASFLRSRDTRATGRLHRGLVMIQVAGSFLLLYGAGSLLSDLVRLDRADHGFQEAGVLTFRVSLPFGQYRGPQTWAPFFDRLVEGLETSPGVASVGVTSGLPMAVGDEPEPWAPIEVAGTESWGARRALHMVVSPGYLETLRIPLREGRRLGSGDGPDDVVVALVDDVVAADLARDGGGVVGRRIEVTRHEFQGGYRVARIPAEIVGVVGTVPHTHPSAPLPGTLYLALAQYPLWAFHVTARGAGDATPAASVAREALAAVDPAVPAVGIRPLGAVVAETLAPTRFVFALLGTLAILVVALTVAGLYGVTTETVRRRQRDLGVRLALGATSSRVTFRVILGGIILAGIGIVPGLLLAPGLASWLRAAIGFGTTLDPLALTVAALLVVGVATGASYLPARRAGRIDAARVLRME